MIVIFIDGPDPQYLEFDRDQVTIGRHADNDVVLKDKIVARHHARIELRAGKLWICDVASCGGIYVDKHRIGREAMIERGTVVPLGNTRLRFDDRPPEPTSEKRPSGWIPGDLVGGHHRIHRVLREPAPTLLAVRTAAGQARTLLVARRHREATECERFVRDRASILFRPIHPNVVPILEGGFDGGLDAIWAAHDPFPGECLADRLARGRIHAGEALLIVSQLVETLAAVHAAGISHGDLRARSIFVADVPPYPHDRPFLRVLDFGITLACECANPDAEGPELDVGHGISPELSAKVHTFGGTKGGDVWALGVLAFEILVGRPFWRTPDDPTALVKQLHLEPIPAASTRAALLGVGSLPAGFDAWFARCVERDPARRFANAFEARAAFRAMQQAW